VVQDPREQTLRWIQQLAAIERPSASSGDRRADEWIIEQLADSATPARSEAEAAQGTHPSRSSKKDASVSSEVEAATARSIAAVPAAYGAAIEVPDSTL
jgi:hypothetical protein